MLNSTPLLLKTVSADRLARGFTQTHVHLSGATDSGRVWEVGIERGMKGIGKRRDFLHRTWRSPDDRRGLTEYLEASHLIDEIQAGPKEVGRFIGWALDREVALGGTLPVFPGEPGSELDPLFTQNQIELRWNPWKRSRADTYCVDRIMRRAYSVLVERMAGHDGELKAGFILCFGRDLSLEQNWSLAEYARGWGKMICGVDLAGPDSVQPFTDRGALADFAEAYRHAANNGRPRGKTVHVGETDYIDLDTFIATVEALEPDRVAHPLVAIKAYRDRQDDRGLKVLKERDIVCELCWWSNFLTGAVSCAREFGEMLCILDDFSIRYLLGTDNPALQRTTQAVELELLLKEDAISPEQLEFAMNVADEATFLKGVL